LDWFAAVFWLSAAAEGWRRNGLFENDFFAGPIADTVWYFFSFPRRMKGMKRSGFTLIELLVVLAVIALLVSILVPALNRSRQTARAVVCAGNLRQLGFAMQEYTMSYRCYPYSFYRDSNFQPPSDYLGNSSYDFQGWWWFQYLAETIGESYDRDSVVFCPSRRIPNEPSPANSPLLGNYGVNQSICRSYPALPSRPEFTGNPLSPEKIGSPSEMLLLGDSGYSLIHWWHVTETPPRPLANNRRDMSYVPGLALNSSKTLEPCQTEDALEGRHPDRSVNVGYADGHVKRIAAEKLQVGYENGDYSNAFPLWQVKK